MRYVEKVVVWKCTSQNGQWSKWIFRTLKARTDIAVTARNILPDVGSEDSKMKMKGDRAAERPKDDSEKSLPCARQVRSFFG
jgi:hypothetical protein